MTFVPIDNELLLDEDFVNSLMPTLENVLYLPLFNLYEAD